MMTPNHRQQAGKTPTLITQSVSEAVYSWSVILSDAGRLTRFAIPWFAILFLMALPLPFLGFFDQAQRHTVSGLDFSATAAVLAISLHGALWLRCVLTDEFPKDIPLPFGLREVGILIGYGLLIGIPLWCWDQAIGLFSSLDHQFIAIHRLAGWFGTQAVIDYGFQNALMVAGWVMTGMAVVMSFTSLKLSLMLVDLALDRAVNLTRAWRGLTLGNTWRLTVALVVATGPFALTAFLADRATALLGEEAVMIGMLEFFATMALFPLSAAMAITLARMTRHVGYLDP